MDTILSDKKVIERIAGHFNDVRLILRNLRSESTDDVYRIGIDKIIADQEWAAAQIGVQPREDW